MLSNHLLVGRGGRAGHQHENRALNASRRKHPKPLARPCTYINFFLQFEELEEELDLQRELALKRSQELESLRAKYQSNLDAIQELEKNVSASCVVLKCEILSALYLIYFKFPTKFIQDLCKIP